MAKRTLYVDELTTDGGFILSRDGIRLDEQPPFDNDLDLITKGYGDATYFNSGNSNLPTVDWTANKLFLNATKTTLANLHTAASIEIQYITSSQGIEEFLPVIRQQSATDVHGFNFFTSIGQRRTGGAAYGGIYIGVTNSDTAINRFFLFNYDGNFQFFNRTGTEAINTFWHSGNSNLPTVDWTAKSGEFKDRVQSIKNTTLDNALYDAGNFEARTQNGGPAAYGFAVEGISAMALYHKGPMVNDILRLRMGTGEDFTVWHSGNKALLLAKALEESPKINALQAEIEKLTGKKLKYKNGK